MMKYIRILIIITALTLFNGCGEQKLPYPLKDVKKGVVVDIVRAENSIALLAAGSTDIKCKVKLTIPKNQGDYSMLDYVQLLCVFKHADGNKISSFNLGDKITEFPTELEVNIADIYSKLNLTEVSLKEEVTITTNIYLKDGTLIQGWNELTGYNNNSFVGWEIEPDRDFSQKVTYPVVCPLNMDDFLGNITINGFIFENEPAKLVRNSDTELEVQFVDESIKVLKLNLIEELHSITGKNQVLLATFSGYTNLSINKIRGRINACEKRIELSGEFTVDQGSFGTDVLTIKKVED